MPHGVADEICGIRVNPWLKTLISHCFTQTPGYLFATRYSIIFRSSAYSMVKSDDLTISLI